MSGGGAQFVYRILNGLSANPAAESIEEYVSLVSAILDSTGGVFSPEFVGEVKSVAREDARRWEAEIRTGGADRALALEAPSLAVALRRHLAPLDSSISVEGYDEAWWHGSPWYAKAWRSERSSLLSVASVEQAIHVDGWDAGVRLVSGVLPSAATATAFLAAWLGERLSVPELAARIGAVEFDEAQVAAHEAGAAAEVELEWVLLRKRWRGDAQLSDVIEACEQSSLLHALFPYTSHTSVCFSRYTGFPYTRLDPSILVVKESAGLPTYIVRSAEAETLTESGSLTQAVEALEAAAVVRDPVRQGNAEGDYGPAEPTPDDGV